MFDNSLTGFTCREVQDLLKKTSYDENNFWILDLSASEGPVTGNKAWKYIENVRDMYSQNKEGILTFGGAYSNHIYQTAKLGAHLKVPTIGMIRADQIDNLNPTLKAALDWGMVLKPIDRATYRRKNDPETIRTFEDQYSNLLIVPEGGTNLSGIKGATQLGTFIHSFCETREINEVALPVGTGGTIAGLINGINGFVQVRGYGALKGKFLKRDIEKWLNIDSTNWSVEDDQTFGGYAKWNQDLVDFIHRFYEKTGLITDPIYVGKMMYKAFALNRLNEKTLYIHTGGQQGNKGFNQRFELSLPTI